MLFKPNLNCLIEKSAGTDGYGLPIPGVKSRDRLAIIKLDMQSAKSSVRADTSATRGNAVEEIVVAEFLLPANTVAEIDDFVIMFNSVFRVVSKFPRYNLQGVLDHNQVSCTYWGTAT